MITWCWTLSRGELGGYVDSLPPSEFEIQLAKEISGQLADDKIVRIYKATNFYRNQTPLTLLGLA
jgi:hypothetical protein